MQKKPKSINALMAYMRDVKGINISGSGDKKKLRYMGYFHGYKGYRYHNNPANTYAFNSFDEVQAIYDFDMAIKTMFYPEIMFLETTFKNYVLEVILEESKSKRFADIYAKLLTDYKAYPIGSNEYKKAINLPKIRYDNDLGFDYNVIGLINKIIEIEGPVSFETMKLRVKEHSNIQVMSEKAKNRLINLLNSFDSQKSYDQTQEFFWPKESNKTLDYFRTNSNRDIYDIPKEEILAAMIQIINVQGSLSLDDLYKETLNVLLNDSSILNKRNANRLSYVYNWAKQTNKIK